MARVTNTQGPAFLVAELATGEEVELSGRHSEDKEAMERAAKILEDYPGVDVVRIEFSPMIVARTEQAHVEADLDAVEEPSEPEEPPVEPEPEPEPEPTGEWDGSWALTVTDPAGNVTPGSLAVEGDTVTLASGGLSGTGPATIDGPELTANLDVPGVGQVSVSLGLDEDDVIGSFTAGGGIFRVTGTRQATDPGEPGPDPDPDPGEGPEVPEPPAGAQVIDWSTYADTRDVLSQEGRGVLDFPLWAGGSSLNTDAAISRDVIRLVKDRPDMGGAVFQTRWPGVYPRSDSDDQLGVDILVASPAERVEVTTFCRMQDWRLGGSGSAGDKGIWMHAEAGYILRCHFGGFGNRLQSKIGNERLPTPQNPAGVAVDDQGREIDVGPLLWTGNPFGVRYTIEARPGGLYRLELDVGSGWRTYLETTLPTSVPRSRINRVSLGRNADPFAGAIREWGRTVIQSGGGGA